MSYPRLNPLLPPSSIPPRSHRRHPSMPTWGGPRPRGLPSTVRRGGRGQLHRHLPQPPRGRSARRARPALRVVGGVQPALALPPQPPSARARRSPARHDRAPVRRPSWPRVLLCRRLHADVCFPRNVSIFSKMFINIFIEMSVKTFWKKYSSLYLFEKLGSCPCVATGNKNIYTERHWINWQ
jgi:hypothetical protein